MEHWSPTTLSWVLMVMRPTPRQLINTGTCVFAYIVIWRATGHKLNSSIEASFCEFAFRLNTVSLASIKLIGVFGIINPTGFEFKWTIFCSLENIPHMHRSINDGPSNTSMTSFSTIPNQARTSQSLMRMASGNMPFMPSMFTFLLFAVRNCDNLIDLTDYFPAGGRKSLFMRFGLAPVSSELSCVNYAFDITPIETLRR